MIKNIQSFVLGLLRASSKQLKELLYFGVSVALHLPAIFVAFYFVFVFGMQDKVFAFGESTINVSEVHILLLIAFMVFLYIYYVKFLKTKLKKDSYTIGQIITRTLLKVRYVMLLTLMINVFMLKFTLTRINTYSLILAGFVIRSIKCFFKLVIHFGFIR